ncbi:DUF397 domain-containing protein [Actinomadura sp. HBU206391]|uniref:DUF397 domain-containing protein n=1 Tax=Actinomadura sp. HBU206391 TaxID=2731692 RepID=UPI00164F6972|nr:DUF397 domain-containing protein [Actinomadura sp. HBU206391]MBC6459721.1 DUF397 domain-containing protein [Actinomadura sp. HBU206391]
MSAPIWRKSSRSDTQGNACVEVASLPGAVGIRDSKNPGIGHLSLSADVFGALLGRIKAGQLGL